MISVEAVAQRVVELLVPHLAPSGPRLVDAAELARVLGVSRDTVYAHAGKLGAQRPFGGKRSRLRFDVDRAVEAWTARSGGARSLELVEPAAAPVARGGRPRRSGTSDGLLPIRGELAA